MTKDRVTDVLWHITIYIALYIWRKEYLYTHRHIYMCVCVCVCVYTFAYIYILADAFNVGI